MFRLRITDIVGVLLTVIVLPLHQQVIAMSTTQLAQKHTGGALGRAVAQRIQADAGWQAAQRIVFFRSRQHWPLITQPKQVSYKHQNQQRAGADGNANLGASEGHSEKSIPLMERGKVTTGRTGGHVPAGGLLTLVRNS